MTELQAKCPICNKMSSTTNERKGWTSGCHHVTGRLISGHGDLPPTENDEIVFEFVIPITYKVIATEVHPSE